MRFHRCGISVSRFEILRDSYTAGFYDTCSSLTTFPAIKKALTRCKGLDLSVWFVLSFIAMMHGKTAMMYCIYIVCGQRCGVPYHFVDRALLFCLHLDYYMFVYLSTYPCGSINSIR